MANASALKESRLEYDDEALHEIDELTERWHQGLAVENLPLANRYIEGEMGVGLVFVMNPREARQYVAFFERKGGLRYSLPIHKGLTVRAEELDAHNAARNGENVSVLIDDVEAMKTIEGVSLTSTVRLQTMDQFRGVGSNFVEKERGVSVCHERLGLTYREVYVLDTRAGIRSQNEGACQAIEGRSKIVNDVTDDTRPSFRDFVVNFQQILSNRRFGVILDRPIWVQGCEGVQFGAKLVKVLHGPIDLYSGTQH